jgi:virulence-associated protein VapD
MITKGIRQGIHFDMNTKALSLYYPKPSWRAAYDDVKSFLSRNGFEHTQGSGYHSTKPMTQADAVNVLTEMLDVLPWLHKCVRVCTVTAVPETYDLMPLFDKATYVPMRETDARPSVLGRIRAANKTGRASLPASGAGHERKHKSWPER